MDLGLSTACIKRLIVLGALISGCVHVSDKDVLIERSKKQTPAWATLPTGKLLKKTGQQYLIYRKASEEELKKTIKSAETQALQNICNLLPPPCKATTADIYYEKLLDTELQSYHHVVFVYVMQKSH